ncbi:MAG: imidazolonepropionase [Planctomycetes bacterium]|nr:imidazolonepropionase [Planctomycetota bacterium]
MLATMGPESGPRRGARMRELGLLRGDVAIRDGVILEAGHEIAPGYRAELTWPARGRLVTPGLVDPHTHAVFAGTREDEFEMRNSGVPYAEIANRGGGIRRSVAQVRSAAPGEILARTRVSLRRMLAHGTTTVEVKSGYGLSLADEVKLLEAARALGDEGPVEVVTTFLGAHEVPPEYEADRAGYVNLVCGQMIPEVARRGLARWCDVFCEKGVFEIDDSRRILEAAKAAGLDVRLHAEEFATIGGAQLAADVGAASADHLMAIDDAGIEALKRAGTVAVLLPGTTFFLGLPKYAPARRLIEAGVPVALATDFNPGSCYTESLQIIFTIAATQLKMTAAEILTACTVNAAHSLRIGDRVGRIAAGMQADLVLWDADDPRQLPYHFGVNQAALVIKKGEMYQSPR